MPLPWVRAGTHTFHAFAQDSIEDYVGLSREEYEELKDRRADAIIDRLEAAVFPGLRSCITFREVPPLPLPTPQRLSRPGPLLTAAACCERAVCPDCRVLCRWGAHGRTRSS